MNVNAKLKNRIALHMLAILLFVLLFCLSHKIIYFFVLAVFVA